MGAILRSGEAFGVAAALLTPGCAWPFSPRALRASAGSAFRLPVAARVAAGEAVAWARRHGIALAGAAAHGGTPPEALCGVRPLVLVIGSEGHGISRGDRRCARPSRHAAARRPCRLPERGRRRGRPPSHPDAPARSSAVESPIGRALRAVIKRKARTSPMRRNLIVSILLLFSATPALAEEARSPPPRKRLPPGPAPRRPPARLPRPRAPRRSTRSGS